MSHPSLENSPRPSPPNPRFTRIHYALLITAGLLLTAIAGMIRWQLLRFIDQDLAAFVATELSKTLNRPVKVGDVQAYSLSHVRFGPTTIPACTPQQSGCSGPDADSMKMKALDIRFNLLPILWSRQLPLEATLIQPQISLDQTPGGEWIATRFHSDPADDGWLNVKLNRVRWQQGTAHLKPVKIEPRQLSQLNGTLNLENPETLYFNTQSQIDSGGKLGLKGEWQPSTKTLDIHAQTKSLVPAPLIGLLTDFPFQINQGQLNGRFRVHAQPQQPITIHTDTTLHQGKIWIPDQAIWLQAPKIQVGLQLQVQPDRPAKIKGKAALEGARVDVPEDLILNNQRQQPRRLSEVKGTVNFLGTQQRFKFDLKGKMGQGGQLQARGVASFLEKKANLRLQLQDLPASLFDRAYQIPMTVDSGRLSASLRVQLRPQTPADIHGTALLKTVTMGIVNVPQPFSRVRGYLRFRGVAVRLEGLKGDYGQIPMQATGWIDPDRGYSLVGQTDWVAAQPLLSTLQVTGLPFPVTGQVKGENLRFEGAIDQPIFSGSVKTAGQSQLDRVPFNQLTAKFRLADALLQMTDIQAKPIGGGLFKGQARLNVQPGGKLEMGLQAMDLPGNQLAKFYNAEPGFALGPLQGQIKLLGPPEDIRTTVNFQAPKGDFPTTGIISIRQNVAQLRDIVTQIPGGKLQTQGQIKDNRVGLTTTIPGVALPAYSTDARGVMTGQLYINAPFDTFSIETARARGQLRFSEGIAIIYDPISAQIRWDGRQILVDQSTAPGFQSQGRIGLAVDTPQGPQLTTLNLAVRAQGYDLGLLPAFGPTQVTLAGRANLTGQLTGTVTNPFLTSTLQMHNLSMGDVLFEPILKGQMRYGQQAQLDLQVSGKHDRIHVALNSDQLPTAFDIRRDQAWARGKTKQGHLSLAFHDIPLTALNWQPVETLGPVSGWSSGKFTLNSQTYAGTGNLTVIRPGIGKFMGDSFSGKLQLAPHAITLDQGTLQDRDNAYQMQAQVLPGANPQFSGALQIQQAEITDILAVANSLTSAPPAPQPQPQGRATDLPTAPVGTAQGSLLMQLRRLAELDTLDNQQSIPQSPDPILPNWEKVSGLFAGQLQFSGSQAKGVDATFALQSQPLKWGNYKIDQVVANGQFVDGNLSLRPLLVTSGDLEARFQGTLGNEQQSGQLTLRNLPVSGLTQLLNLPFAVEGMINGKATLAGSIANPHVQGEVNWTDATLNTLSLTQAQTKFAYDQGRLTFEGGSKAIPLQFSGTIPYQLPFTTVGPNNDALQVSLKIKDQGLALFNLLTDQLSWVEGQGEVDLEVAGTLEQPLMEGKIQFNKATLASELLLEPLTQVTGSIQFDQNDLQVNQLTGLYSRGQLQATGGLPIFISETRRSRDSLQVALKALQLNAKGLYKGQIDGDLTISGAVLEPQLGGVMALTNGQVILADVNGNATPSLSGQLGQTPPLKFKNLQVQLKDNVRVTQPPLISFLATGQVLVNGSVNTPRPDGRIHFQKGSVNLFTSRFRIDSRQDNFADFDPSLGLDPYLSIGMVTTATDIVGGRATELNEFEDLPAGRVGAIESIRVRATVEGHASELINDFNQVIDLSSTPNRSEREILALLGGSLPSSLENGNTELALANLASSAFLTGFEGLFADALGTRANFRLFPVLIPNDSQDTSVLAFGAELGYDITDRFSVSALQILTGLDEATLLNASYDINEQLRIRSAISTDGEAVGILEYRIRF